MAMIVKDVIRETIPPLKTSDSCSLALQWMKEFHVRHLPVIEEKEYLGLVSEEDILNHNNPEDQLVVLKSNITKPFVFEHQHLFDAIKLVSEYKVTLLAVLTEDKFFLGTVSLPDLLEAIAGVSALQSPGGILVLDISLHDYSLTEIANIIESNNALVLSLYVTSTPDSLRIEVTVKLNITDLTRVMAGFERFGYAVKSYYHVSEFTDDLKNRFDSFMNYLNI